MIADPGGPYSRNGSVHISIALEKQKEMLNVKPKEVEIQWEKLDFKS